MDNKTKKMLRPTYNKILLKKEKKYLREGVELKYIFEKKKLIGKNKLVVVLSAFSPKDSSVKATYNYNRHLKNLNTNKLFILDNYGPNERGCYYLGQNRDFIIEKSVYSLIEKTRKECNIKKKDVVIVGSSKGGWAALYYGIKYEYGHVIAGAPQTLLGNYLVYHNQYLRYIAGGTTVEDVEYLNNLLYGLKFSNKTKINIHVSRNDTHYINHVIPFANHLKNNNIDFILDIDGYNGHSKTGDYFGKYLKDNIFISGERWNSKIFDENKLDKLNYTILKDREERPVINEVIVTQDKNYITVTVKNEDLQNLEYAYYIINDKNKVIDKIMYSDNNNLEYKFNIPGRYTVRAFARNKYKNDLRTWVTSDFINIDEIGYKSSKNKTFNIENNIILDEHINNLDIIGRLAKFELKKKYSDSILGWIWTFVQPIILIAVYGFAFGTGVRGGAPVSVNGINVSFFLWYLSAIIPWFFIRDGLLQGSVSLYQKSSIITQIKFPLSIIPTYTLVSYLIIHMVMLLVTSVIYISYGFMPDMYYIQLIYYIFSTFMFLWGLSFITSSITIIIRDFNVLLNSIATGVFFLTPIMWTPSKLPSWALMIVKLNPIYYLITGYRNTFLYKVWFWENLNYALYFWGLVIVIFFIGFHIHKTLRPRFVDKM
jgi:teichoic acid transport system permease protein